jgi:hypothetical protein
MPASKRFIEEIPFTMPLFLMRIDTAKPAGYHASLHAEFQPDKAYRKTDQSPRFYYSRFTLYDLLIHGFRNYSNS